VIEEVVVVVVVVVVDMVGSVLTHDRLIPLAAATMNPQPQQLRTPNLLQHLLVHRHPMIAWNKLERYNNCWLP